VEEEQGEKIVLQVDEEEQVLMLVVVAVEVLDIQPEQVEMVVVDRVTDVVEKMVMLEH